MRPLTPPPRHFLWVVCLDVGLCVPARQGLWRGVCLRLSVNVCAHLGK